MGSWSPIRIPRKRIRRAPTRARKAVKHSVRDEPADEDAFDGPHKKVADALVEILTSEDGGRAVGLEDEWGSGKSTVIEIAKKRLEEGWNGENILFFVFDAWAHEGDTLRKTFLKRLAEELQKKGWLTKTTSKELEETILEPRARPKITLFGYLAIAAALAAPVAPLLIRIPWKDEFPSGTNAVALVVAAAPLTIFIVYLFCRIVTGFLPLPRPRYVSTISRQRRVEFYDGRAAG